MFVSFLYPFRLRTRLASYLWIAYKQITDLTPEQVCFIASRDYQVDPADYAAAKRFECSAPRNDELGFVVPSARQLRAYQWHEVPLRIYQRLKAEHRADSLIWLHLIQQEDTELTRFLCDTITEIDRHQHVQALLTWCNFRSVERAGEILGLPVMHFELGPLRDPWYRPLGYLDFRGVNGHTEAADRYQCFLSAEQRPQPLSRQQLLASLQGSAYQDEVEDPEHFAVGISLQVEDDSNLLAYHQGFTPALVLEYAREYYPDAEILIRAHPAGHFGPPKDMPMDDSPTSAAFVRRCRSLLTLNSSVAVEAMLAGRPTTVLGEAPAALAANTRLPAERLADEQALDYLLLGYCVPYGLIFDADYLHWRLSRPREGKIHQQHTKIIMNK